MDQRGTQALVLVVVVVVVVVVVAVAVVAVVVVVVVVVLVVVVVVAAVEGCIAGDLGFHLLRCSYGSMLVELGEYLKTPKQLPPRQAYLPCWGSSSPSLVTLPTCGYCKL